MRRNAGILGGLLLLLAGCMNSPLPPFEIRDLTTDPHYYCTNRGTDLYFSFQLERGPITRIEFWWLKEDELPGAEPDLVLEDIYYPGLVGRWIRVYPDGKMGDVVVYPQSIAIEPSLPNRRLWVRGYAYGYWSPLIPGPLVRPRLCDP